MKALVTISLISAFLLSGCDKKEYRNYDCEDRGGVRQAVGDRNGSIESVVCEDGTIHAAYYQVEKD